MNIGIMLNLLHTLEQQRQRERWTRQQLQAYQEDSLRRLRKYAYEKSPFYQDFHKGMTNRPLQELPVLTKAIMMENFDELVTDRSLHLEDIRAFAAQGEFGERFRNQYYVTATSGSSGHPGFFLFNEMEWDSVLASFARGQEWSGVRINITRRQRMATVASISPWHMSSQVAATVVWGGYIHRGRLQKVKVLLNQPLASIPEGMRQLAELTVPYTHAMRYTKTYGWQPNLRLYYGSVHWIDGIDEGPDGLAWYRIFDELVGYPYHAPALHLRPIALDEWSSITPEGAPDEKRIEVNLSKQVLTAYEHEQVVFETTISSGITTANQDAKALSTQTPTGEFRILSKYPSKHMGNGNLFATLRIMN